MAIVDKRNDGFAFSFGRGELDLDGKIYTRIENIACSQPIEEGVIFGSSLAPIDRTEGQQQIGDGTIEFSDIEEAASFLDRLGEAPEGRLMKIFQASWVLRHPRDDSRIIKVECRGCRLLDWELDASQGPDGIPMVLPFSFMKRLLNGKPDIGE